MMKKMKLCLPVGWRMIKARYLFRFSRGYTIGRADMGDTGVACIHYGDIHGDYHFAIDINTARLGRIDEPLRFGVSEYVSAGQFLFAGSSEDYEGSGNFTLIRGNRSAIAGTDTIVLTPYSDMDVDYTAYLFDSLFFREQIRPHMMGTKVFHPSQKVIKSAWCIVPPQNESRQIVQYLNRETLWIDGVIEKLRREVELLEQYRRELIARTVMRGLDPDVPMRDSGIEWIGEIPEAWALLRISALYDIRSQKVNDTDYQPLSVTMNGVVAQLEHVAKTNDGDNRKLVRAGDFVINSRSDRRGACGIAPKDGSCSLINIVLSPQQSIHNPYFSYLFRSSLFADEFYRWGHGIHDDLWTTNWADMKSIQVPVPPLNHQVLIADYLDKKMSEINSTITGINNQIELLGKYRKQVINDAVTGKICVEKVA
ncbi:restriction endonuclease subunit S [Rothia aeria]|jgi:restriction modification system DNA specificity subunit|uniref:restriction endonuclease subunit S n=1 Tax=Rothia aeria TaxID=172042 RepID=UPI002551700B|nr:restriction endonuclease subunit S [Rothia aeria]MDK7351841.1 restriction endonuclease subunit S [Rothia aeria]